MSRIFIFLAGFLLVLYSASPAKASEDIVSFGVGYYDVFDDESAADWRLEYRWDYDLFWELKPFAGVEVTTDGSLYGNTGLYKDFFISDEVFVTPSFAVGIYEEGGSDLNLGYFLEFRSQIEIGYEFESGRRLSLGLSHISNASLGEHNPGTEILGIYYHVPVSKIFGAK